MKVFYIYCYDGICIYSMISTTTLENSEIPRILHQMWIGDKAKCPSNLMKSWKILNPSFEYIFWNEEEIIHRKMKFECEKQIKDIIEINGKCDIMRWEILYKYGGVFIDTDFYPFRNIMEREKAIHMKFLHNEELKSILLSTKRAQLNHYIGNQTPEIAVSLMKVRSIL